MPFKFAPRALLELGKELISSDEVALYELIKNGIDAGSKRISITAQILLTHSTYQLALEALDDGDSVGDVINMITQRLLPGTSEVLREAFLSDLRKAGSDPRKFSKALVSAYGRHNWIEVGDEGEGMSLAKLNDVYLTVGTRSRRADNLEGAKYLGDKGVGRLSAMRLGDELLVTTSTDREANWNVLRINWALFTHETVKPLNEIEVEAELGPKKDKRSDHGTVLRISHLNADWDRIRFITVFQGPIARVVDPFEPGRGNQLLLARHNGERVVVPSIPQKLLAMAHATCKASFRLVRGQPVIDGEVNYPYRNRKTVIAQRGTEVLSIAQTIFKRRGKRGHAAVSATPIRLKALQELGPFDVEIFWYNRLVVEPIEGLTDSIQETRDEIARWSGGPMLYRNGFRILPYGDPGDDWVGLDRNAFGQSGFKLNRQQVLGRVRVTAAHTALSEQTSREGLVESDAASALKIIVMWLLHHEMRTLINEADRAEKINQREAEKIAYDFRATQKQVEQTLEEIRKRVGPEQKTLVERLGTQVTLLVDQCEQVAGATGKVVEDAASDREKFVHLAGIGLMTEFIFHELDRAVSHTVKMLGDATQSKSGATLRSLEAQLATLQKRVSAFDELSGERRQTKSNFDVAEVVGVVLESHEGQFNRHGIKVHYSMPKPPLRVRAVRGMVIQILENLIANAVYWLKQHRRFNKEFKGELWIKIDAATKSLSVEDNGPGIDPRRKDVIFEPFVTSKPPGQGRGLGLYISRELAHYHGWQLYLDEAPGHNGADRLSRFVLDMDGEE